MGTGFNQNLYMPWITPQTNFYGINPLWSTALQNTKEEKSEEKLQAEKAADDFLKRLQLIKENEEKIPMLQEQIKQIEDASKEVDKTIQKATKGKESQDGTIKTKETWEDYKKLPFWKKALRAGTQMAQGTWKIIEGFAGYEVDEKTGESHWNWKKGLKNAAIAAGCIALTAIPYVGPVISTGLLATGVACGAYGAGKGICKAVNAESPEELDNAFQDIGAGISIGTASALGLRGLGKGLQASAAQSGAAVTRATGSNTVSQFAKDATINAYRATVQGMKNDGASVAANGFWKTYGANLKGMVPKLGKSKYEKSHYETTQQINSRLNNISQELNNPNITPVQKALLEREQILLEAQKTQIRSTFTKDSWKDLAKNSKLHEETTALKKSLKDLQANGTTDINGTVFNASSESVSALEQAIKRSEKLSKQIELLSKMRSSTMKKMAFCKKYASEVEAYTGKARNNRLGRIYDTAKISKSEISWKKPIKLGWDAMMLPFKPWNYLSKSATTTFYKLEETLVPEYSAGMLDEFMEFGSKVLKTKIIAQNEKGETFEQEVAVTKDILSQLEEQKKQYDEALSKAQQEFNNIYVA